MMTGEHTYAECVGGPRDGDRKRVSYAGGARLSRFWSARMGGAYELDLNTLEYRWVPDATHPTERSEDDGE